MPARSAQPFSQLPLLVVLAVLLFGLPRFVALYLDWLWFQELDHAQIFVRSLAARFAIGGGAFALAFAVLFLNFELARRSLGWRRFTVVTQEGPRSVTLDPLLVRPLVWVAAGGAALLLAFSAAGRWESWLLYLQAEPFGEVDPVLGYDVGFYVFSLPLLQSLKNQLTLIVLLAAAGVAGAHAATGNLGVDADRGFFAARAAKRHLAALAALLFALLAFGAWLAAPALLTDPSTVIQGASFADVEARMPALRVLVAAALAGAALSLYQIFTPRLWPLAAAAGLYLAVSFGGVGYAAIVQRFIVAPNEQIRETPFIVHNIHATRAAFALDRVVERELSGDAELTREAIDANSVTFDNVPLWNDQPLLDTFSQIQEIRTYYDFVSVDNDRYTIDGEYRQIMLSARELNSESLPARTWINERLTFTHGYGLTLGPVNEVTPEGLPVLFIKDLPPQSSVDLRVSEPALYFGELSSDHAFVNTRTQEFDYPEGEDNAFTTYRGEGGIPLGGILRRLLFALYFRSTDTLFSPNLHAESRVLMFRRIQERVRRIAPFLSYDKDPYLAIDEGRLYWIQDAYTTSTDYPYSTPVARGGINYIRNSIKVVIDAYHGDVTFYRIDPEDPIARTWGKIFPALLEPLERMPEGLRSRLRYPQDIFAVQTSVFATYHMTSPAVFYNREDQWQIPVLDGAGITSRMDPYYTIMRLPGESGAEYIQMLPFTPRQKDNLAAWMVARSDGDAYGQLMVFQFPKQKVIFGPRQVVARINQDQKISPQITLWNQQGSEVIQGTLLVIPVGESLVYIRPLYLRSAGGRIPELKRVIVAYQNQIVMEPTLDAALEQIFPSDSAQRAARRPAAPADEPASAPAAAGAARQDLGRDAREAYRRAIEAQREGDWSRYGEELGRLGELLERLAAPEPGE